MVIVCGTDALNPELVADICKKSPFDEVYALPWITSSSELIRSVSENRGRPNRLFPCHRNTQPYEGDFEEFDDKLNSDALGRMANLVSNGVDVVNEVMTCPCPSSFYGRLITNKVKDNTTYLVRVEEIPRFFPCEPISATLYAASTVPVSFRNTDCFSKSSGCANETVGVVMANAYIPGTVEFLRFYKLFCGRGYIATLPTIDCSSAPLFRYNRGYRRLKC